MKTSRVGLVVLMTIIGWCLGAIVARGQEPTKKETVTFKVISAGASKNGGLIFLNENKYDPFKTSEGWTVVVQTWHETTKKYKSLKPKVFEGKIVTVTGEPSMFQGQKQIVVTDEKQITVK